MANNYTQFSLVVPLRKGKHVFEAANKILLAGFEERSIANDEGRYEDLDDLGFDFSASTRNDEIYIYAEESGNPDDVVSFLETLLQRNLALEPIMFEWAFTCSSPRVGEFGGGGALVTKTGTHWFVPVQSMIRKWDQIKKQRSQPKRKKRQ